MQIQMMHEPKVLSNSTEPTFIGAPIPYKSWLYSCTGDWNRGCSVGVPVSGTDIGLKTIKGISGLST